MAKQIRNTLKSFFQTGDVPTENNYADLVDSNLNLSENNTGNIQLTGEITASGNISSSGNINAIQISGSHISASGNISASNFRASNNIIASGNISAIQISGSHISASGNITVTGSLGLTTNLITASQDISASGQVLASSFRADGLMAVKSVFSQNSNFTGSLFEDGNYKAITIGRFTEPTKNISLFGPVTASGNISSSGNFIINNITASGNISSSGNLIASTLNTGQGDNELFDMDQNVTTTSAVTFATVNTGQGDNELYDMNQNVKTTSAVTFSTLSIPIIDLSQVTGNAFTADFGDGTVDAGSAYGGSITISNVPSTDARFPITNFRVTAARCQAHMIVVASSDSKILVNPNQIQSGAFFLDLSCGTSAFAGGTVRINFQILGA